MEAIKELQAGTSSPKSRVAENVQKTLLETYKEFSILFGIRNINERANQVIAVAVAFVCPLAANVLRLDGKGAKTLFQFQPRVCKQFVGHSGAVIEPEWQQQFVARYGLSIGRGTFHEKWNSSHRQLA